LRDGAQIAQLNWWKYANWPENPAGKILNDLRFLFNRCCATARKSRNPQFTFARADGYLAGAVNG
jgi:hypothetical protein